MSFLGIHNHTDVGSNLRLRDSTNKIKDLIDYTHELGHKGVCITDHEALTAHINALEYYESKREDETWKDFKLGLGNEIYLCDDVTTAENIGNNIYPHFILIALDAEGHKGLRELSTKAWVQNAFMHVMYRIPTYYGDLEEMMSKYKGHIIGSSACLGGTLPRLILKFQDSPDEQEKRCLYWIDYINDIFGNGYFFLELQPSKNPEQVYVNKKLVEFSKKTGVPYLVSTDAHYLKKEDRSIHKAFLDAQDGDREVDEFYATTYVMSEEEIHSYMDEYLGEDVVQQGLDNTMLIYDKLKYYKLTKDLEIPYIPQNTEEPDEKLVDKYKDKVPLFEEFAESKYDSDRHLIRELVLCMETDPHYRTKEAYEKIEECLSYVKSSSDKMGVRWSAYLLQVADYIKIAWDAGTLVGPGRGSGIGFCLLNMLGITQINPMREKTQTFPWRFLNPERASVLDIDIDIMSCKRDIVIQALKEVYGQDRVSKVMTLSTEKSKSAILTAARGLGIDNATASYLASLVIFDRGQPRSLSTMYYGNEDYPPSPDFVREMNEYPELWEVAQKIEGLVCGVGSHAGGVIIVDKPFTDSAALMRTKSGDVITQFDLHVCEKLSLIKIDLLCIDALDKIYETLMLLLEDGQITWQGSLKKTYEKYIGVYTLEREAEDMWKMLWEHKVLSFFQMEKESGKQAIALSKPHSVDDLATLNSVLRLMAQEKGGETPLHKYARFKNDITQWYDEMTSMGLDEEEQEILKGILGTSCGICEAQEYLFLLVMHPKIGGFSLAWADKLRKAVSKKNAKDFDKLEEEFFESAKKKRLSDKLTSYVWKSLIYTQKSYGFNKSHTLAYSIVGLQELNLCYKYNPIYWQTANLIVDSGSLDQESNDATNYGKMAVAIALIQQEGVTIEKPLVEKAQFGFKPDVSNNQIVFGLKGINGINTEIAQAIIQNRPYHSFEDFCEKLVDTKIVQPSKMSQLIKAGCFVNLHNTDRRKTMDCFLRRYIFTPCAKLTMQQFKKVSEMKLIPIEYKKAVQIIRFKQYVLDDVAFIENYVDPTKKPTKKGYHDKLYILDNQSQQFFIDNFSEDSIVRVQNGFYVISEKKFSKEANKLIEPLKAWLGSDEALNQYNQALYQQIWDKYAKGSLASWSMAATCCYYGEHELAHVNEEQYGIVNFFDLPEEPEAYEFYTRYVGGKPKYIPKNKISRIAGTVLNTDNNRHTVFLLTKYGVVNVKFNKGHYAFYNKQISVKKDPNSKKKTVIEESWLKRGSKIIVAGVRREDQFFPMIYADTIYKHTINLIKKINNDRTLELQLERYNTKGADNE